MNRNFCMLTIFSLALLLFSCANLEEIEPQIMKATIDEKAVVYSKVEVSEQDEDGFVRVIAEDKASGKLTLWIPNPELKDKQGRIEFKTSKGTNYRTTDKTGSYVYFNVEDFALNEEKRPSSLSVKFFGDLQIDPKDEESGEAEELLISRGHLVL
jgi:hypothetical protein